MKNSEIDAIADAYQDLENIADKLEEALSRVEHVHCAVDYLGRIRKLAAKGDALCDELYEHGRRVPTYPLSSNQEKFVADAEQQGLDVTYDYSGRGMCGRMCPAVVVGGPGGFGTKAITRSDSLGLDIVIYAEN